MRSFLTILFILSSFAIGLSQNIPDVPGSGKSSQDFVPDNYKLNDELSTDINGDGKEDKVLILEEDTDWYEDRPRIIAVVFNEGEGYQLKAQNNYIVMRVGHGGVWGDPYDGMSPAKNGFKLNFYGGSNWRWNITYQFRYENVGFRLIGVESVSIFTGDGRFEKWSYNLLSGKMKYSKGDSHEDPGTESWHDLEISKPILLSDYVEGYEPDFYGGKKF